MWFVAWRKLSDDNIFLGIGVLMAIRFLWQKKVIRAIQPSNTYKLYKKYFPEWMHIVVTLSLVVFCFILFRTHVMTSIYNNRIMGLPLDVTIPADVTALIKQDIPSLLDTNPIHWYDMALALYTKIFFITKADYFKEWLFAFWKIKCILAISYLLFLIGVEYKIGKQKIEDAIGSLSKTH